VKFPLAKSVELSAKMSNENNSHLASGMCEREILAEVFETSIWSCGLI